jgi:transposase-like protein
LPRKSSYTMTLSPEQRIELEARARRYTLPYRDVVRAKIVLMAAAGLDNDEIAARLDTRREIVSKWRKRFFEQGLAGLEERPRGGRPPAFPPEVVVAVKALACELPSRLGVPFRRRHPTLAVPVHRARIFGRCEPTTGIEPFGRLVEQVMTTEPYASARRVFWVVDNGSSHRGQRSVDRVRQRWPKARLVQLPVHASWLNRSTRWRSTSPSCSAKSSPPTQLHGRLE